MRTLLGRRIFWGVLASSFAIGLVGAGCGDSPYIELQIADTELPFLAVQRDFDGVRVDVQGLGCADTAMRFPAQPLPATVTVMPGECYTDALELRATVTLGERDVARSGWVEAAFPDGGAVVVTATLADVPGRRTLFATGFEPGEPSGDLPVLPLAARSGFADAVARLDTDAPLTGGQSARLTGTATTASARMIARIAVTNVLITTGDELVLTLELGAGSAVAHVGIDLELSTGATASSLSLRDRMGRPIAPTSDQGRAIGAREQWVVDLSPAAGTRLVGVLIGADLGGGGAPGALDLRADDLAVVRP